MRCFFMTLPLGLSEVFMFLAEDPHFRGLLDKVPVYFLPEDPSVASHGVYGRLDGLQGFSPEKAERGSMSGAISLRIHGIQKYWHCAPMFHTPLIYGAAFDAMGVYIFLSKEDYVDPAVGAHILSGENSVPPIGLGAWADRRNKGRTAMSPRMALDKTRSEVSDFEVSRMEAVTRRFAENIQIRDSLAEAGLAWQLQDGSLV